jgi:hypothetical protein
MNGSNNQKEIPFGPGRVCFDALISGGLHGVDGGHPHCLGPVCSRWSECMFQDAAFASDILKLRKHLGSVHAKTRGRGSRGRV